MRGAMSVFPLHAFMAWTQKIFTLHCLFIYLFIYLHEYLQHVSAYNRPSLRQHIFPKVLWPTKLNFLMHFSHTHVCPFFSFIKYQIMRLKNVKLLAVYFCILVCTVSSEIVCSCRFRSMTKYFIFSRTESVGSVKTKVNFLQMSCLLNREVMVEPYWSYLILRF